MQNTAQDSRRLITTRSRTRMTAFGQLLTRSCLHARCWLVSSYLKLAPKHLPAGNAV